eukprot:12431468-Karenia_brevis.AAC.3
MSLAQRMVLQYLPWRGRAYTSRKSAQVRPTAWKPTADDEFKNNFSRHSLQLADFMFPRQYQGVLISLLCGCIFVGPAAVCVLAMIPPSE